MNLQTFDRAVYDRASRKKSKGFDRALYDRMIEERLWCGGAPASAAAIAGSPHAAASGGDPSTVTSQTLRVWYKTDTVTSSGGTVSAMADKSASGKNLGVSGVGCTVNATDASLSNLQTVTLASGQGLFNNTSVSIAAPFTAMLAVKPNTGGWVSAAVLFGQLSTSGIVFAGGSPAIYQNLGSYSNNQNAPLGVWYLIWCEFTNSTSDRIKVGSNAFTATPGTNSGNTTLTSIGFNLAAGPATSNITIREAAIWGGIITGPERTAVTAYIAAQSASIAV